MNLKKIIWMMISITIGMSENMTTGRVAYVFDLDDTLIKTEAKIYLFNSENELVGAYTSAQLRDQKKKIQKKLDEGYRLNFDEIGDDSQLSYEYLFEGKRIKKNWNLFSSIYDTKPEDLYILTGRGNDPSLIQSVFRDRWDMNLPRDHILTVAHKDTFDGVRKKVKDEYKDHPIYEIFEMNDSPIGSIHKKKKMCIFSILMTGYDELHFLDDDKKNIEEIEELKKDLKRYPDFDHVKITNYWIREEA